MIGTKFDRSYFTSYRKASVYDIKPSDESLMGKGSSVKAKIGTSAQKTDQRLHSYNFHFIVTYHSEVQELVQTRYPDYKTAA